MNRPAPAPRRPSRAALARLRAADPALGAALARLGPYPGFPVASARRESHLEHLARAIVYQQLAGAAARTIWRRACALTPRGRFPRPDELARLRDATLRGAGLSAGKIAALRDLAAHVSDGRLVLASVARLPDAQLVERLVAVRGIGPWTAQMFLIFRLGRLDVMPDGDLGIQEGLRRLDGLPRRPTPKEVVARAAAWAPLRTVAAWTLWRLTDAPAET